MSQVLRCDQCNRITDKPEEYRTIGHGSAWLYGPYQLSRERDGFMVTADVCSVRCAVEWMEAQLTPGLPAELA